MSLSRYVALACSILPGLGSAQNGPGPSWSTFLGGNGFDAVDAWDQVSLAPNGDVLVCGRTASFDFPRTSGPGLRGMEDGFVARLNSRGQIVWAVLIGGSGRDDVRAVVCERNGDVLIAGRTSSSDFPTTPGAYQTAYAGGSAAFGDGFVARLTNAVTGPPILSWCTYLGGTDDDTVLTLATHPAGFVIAGGWTASLNFPTAGQPYQPGHAPQTCGTIGNDGFISVLDPTAQGIPQLVFGSYLGGRCDDMVHDVEIWQGSLLVAAGRTGSPDFRTTSTGFDRTLGGPQDAFVVVLDLALTTLAYGTYVGGDGDEQLHSMALMATGEVVLGGQTTSTNFPTTPGALQQTFLGGGYYGIDAFLARLDLRRTGPAQLTWGTYLGGTGWESIMDVAVEQAGIVTAVGAVNSPNFPTTAGAYDRTFNGGGVPPIAPFDGFVCRLDPDATGSAQLLYSTVLGGALAEDNVTDVALTPTGAAIVVGFTLSADFPASGIFRGNSEVFIAELDMLPTGVAKFGLSTSCLEHPRPGSYAAVNSMPSRGNLAFELWCHNAFDPTLLIVGAQDFNGWSIPYLGITTFVQLSQPTPIPVWVPANPLGFARQALPIPVSIPLGSRVACQFISLAPPCNPCNCPLLYFASNALDVTVQ